VISTSPTDLEPVMQAVVENAARLCGAMDSSIFRLEGEHLRLMARHGPLRVSYAIGESFPVAGTVSARILSERRTIHVADIWAVEAEYPLTASRARGGMSTVQTMAGTPLLREGIPLGVLFINRGPEPDPFTAKQIALLETFANQAVIAIENVRLFAELQEKNRALTQAHTQVTEALEQQTATSEILRVISSSPTEVQPVFDAIVRSAVRLCDGTYCNVARFDGELVHQVAVHNLTSEAIDATRQHYPRPPSRKLGGGRAILDRAVCHIPDVESDPGYDTALARVVGHRSVLAVPMLREGNPIGAIAVGRAVPGPFSTKQIELLQTFAAQAVIAIENVRLFTELEARTRELGRSVDELKALGEVGRAVSSTLDLQTVLTTIVSRAVELSGTSGGVIYEHNDATGEFRLRASHGVETELVEVLREAPFRLGEGVTGRAAAFRAPMQVTDLLAEREFAVAHISPIAEGLGYRSVLAVPLLLEDRAMGGLTVWRKQPGGFAPEVVHLLQTFGAQSSLAIQNARLFREIADKSRLLEAASRHK
jgi:GAF domain-containing protein